jgi:hypothetical protein
VTLETFFALTTFLSKTRTKMRTRQKPPKGEEMLGNELSSSWQMPFSFFDFCPTTLSTLLSSGLCTA